MVNEWDTQVTECLLSIGTSRRRQLVDREEICGRMSEHGSEEAQDGMTPGGLTVLRACHSIATPSQRSADRCVSCL